MAADTVRDEADPLPDILPIFPLSGALLLPRARLPLMIFEPRYLAMVDDALKEQRLIGLMQPKHPHGDPVPDGAEIWTVGCCGRIVSFAETGDGRYSIALLGVRRFRVGRECARAAGGYRRVAADFAPFGGDEISGGELADRKRLLAAAKAFFAARGLTVDGKALAVADDEALATSLAIACPFPAEEKQALLECADTRERGELLVTILEMAARAPSASPGAARH